MSEDRRRGVWVAAAIGILLAVLLFVGISTAIRPVELELPPEPEPEPVAVQKLAPIRGIPREQVAEEMTRRGSDVLPCFRPSRAWVAPDDWGPPRTRDGVAVQYEDVRVAPEKVSETLEQVLRILDEAALLLDEPRREGLRVYVHRDTRALQRATGVSGAAGLYDGSVHLAMEDKAERFERTMRHELMHAQMMRLGSCGPLWFVEGTAEYFERPGQTETMAMLGSRTITDYGDHRLHDTLERLLATVLEGVRDPEKLTLSMRPQSYRAYQQSDLMVRWMVQVHGEERIAEAFHHMRVSPDPMDLWQWVAPDEDIEWVVTVGMVGLSMAEARAAWLAEQE